MNSSREAGEKGGQFSLGSIHASIRHHRYRTELMLKKTSVRPVFLFGRQVFALTSSSSICQKHGNRSATRIDANDQPPRGMLQVLLFEYIIVASSSSRVVPIQKKGLSQNEQKPPFQEVFQDLLLLYGIQYHSFEFL